MSIYELKPRFQNLLRPLVRRLYSAGVTANAVTIAACVERLGALRSGVFTSGYLRKPREDGAGGVD